MAVAATPTRTLPPLQADLLLAHAPAFFEFRDRRDIYFPILETAGAVPITPLYEYFPVGFKSLERHLEGRGHSVKLLNLATLLLRYPKLDIERVFEALDVGLVGFDLHWMVHVQGTLEIAERLKRSRPDLPIILGGISATYYADELIRYPFVDYVMRGYDTHEPMTALMQALADGRRPEHVPNLLWKEEGSPRSNPFDHLPASFACGLDWSSQPEAPESAGLPIRELLSMQNAGCAYNCPWCGGSRDAFRRIFGREKAMARKPLDEIAYEFETMRALDGIDDYHFYSVGSYNEPKPAMMRFLDHIAATPLKSVSYEQFFLTPEEVMKKMVAANARTSITLSPESHDRRVSKLAGRGVYSNEELEAWIERALEIGIAGIDIWYFVGMPEQDERSVEETVDYCERLLGKFPGTGVNPMVCPMIPLLDPGSNIFEDPDAYGYRIFHRTAEEHRRAMERASLIHRVNYETRWLPRFDLVRVGLAAVRRLMASKASSGFLPRSLAGNFARTIDDAWEFLQVVHEADSLAEPDRTAALAALGDDIQRRNDLIFFHGVANQAFPLNRQVGGRWFDELGWSVADLDAAAIPVG